MAPINALTWAEFYTKHRDDGGVFEEFFDRSQAAMSARTTTHFNNPGNLTDTICGSAHGNMMLIPGITGQIHLLHHGFPCNTPDGMALVFVQGNLSDCAYFKVIDREIITEPIKSPTARGNKTPNCPALDSMLDTTTAAEFKALPAQGNMILKNKPNHLMIEPDVFLLVNGTASFNAKKLATTLIGHFRPKPTDNAEDLAERREGAVGAELLLAFLWASENGGLTPVLLQDVPNNLALNQIIRNVKSKLYPEVANTTPEGATGGPANEAAEDRVNQAEAWALASQSIVNELSRMQEGREAERVQTEISASLFKTMGPTQKTLFTTLCRVEMTDEPVMTDLMKL